MKKIGLAVGILTISLGFAYYTSGHPMDFRVYHYGARGVFDGSRPVYGETSGLGWPMHYRYPPLFLLLFAPFAALPLGLAASVWVVLKVGVLIWLLGKFGDRRIIPQLTFEGSFAVNWGMMRLSPNFLVSFLFITPYLIEEFRYGNAQFFVIA